MTSQPYRVMTAESQWLPLMGPLLGARLLAGGGSRVCFLTLPLPPPQYRPLPRHEVLTSLEAVTFLYWTWKV